MSIYRWLRHLASSVLMILALFSGGLALAQAPASSPAWTQKTITVQAENVSLQTLVARLADETGQSILVEGQPLDRKISLSTTDTVDKVLTDISGRFDYDWKISKSGIILLCKRFKARDSLPEFNIPELKAVAENIAETIRAVYPDADARIRLTDRFGLLASSLTQAQIQALLDGQRLKIGDLAPEQQRLAERVIYMRLLQKTYENWQTLHDELQTLPNASIRRKLLHVYVNPSSPTRQTWSTELDVPGKEGYPIVFALHYQDIGQDSLLKNEPDAPEEEPEKPLLAESVRLPARRPAGENDCSLGLCTLERTIQALQSRVPGKITVSPLLLPRRLIVELRGASAPRVLDALAEMYDWALTKTDVGSCILLPRSGMRPQKIQDVGPAIKVLLPYDLRRFLLAGPDTKQGEIFHYLPLPAYRPYEIAERANIKLAELRDTETQRLYKPIRERVKEKPLFYPFFTDEQRGQCVRILTLAACEHTIVDLSRLLIKLTTYQEKPQDGFICYHQGDGKAESAWLSIGGEIKPDQQGGEFGVPLALERFASPVR